jgi:hypothetical protein
VVVGAIPCAGQQVLTSHLVYLQVVAVAGSAQDRVQRGLGAGPMACGDRRVEPLSRRQVHDGIVRVRDAVRLPARPTRLGRPGGGGVEQGTNAARRRRNVPSGGAPQAVSAAAALTLNARRTPEAACPESLAQSDPAQLFRLAFARRAEPLLIARKRPVAELARPWAV